MTPIKRLLSGIAIVLAFTAASDMRAAEPQSEGLVKSLLRQAPELRSEVLKMALDAAHNAAKRGLVQRQDLLTVIDYSLPSTQPRLFVFDLVSRKLLFRELVAHGKNSGGNVPSFFSNSSGSLASSIGLFVTADPYIGGNGYSLRLKGLEEGINDMAWDRAIVMHGASYVSQEAIKILGRLGRSWGCPAVRPEVAHKIIDTVRGGTAVFAYYPEKSWLATSAFIRSATKTTQSAAR
ncbi:MAG TPA: murein L,D-transpeptidase catalytic domain family protein [Thermoanaerobaculia bacterium]|nr:murein L,D-transpeptidase catalytic domain family protein [Thermoanaerobaculia bacterium]